MMLMEAMVMVIMGNSIGESNGDGDCGLWC